MSYEAIVASVRTREFPNADRLLLGTVLGNQVVVGKDTWEGSLDCIQPRGLMVSFGNASGAVTGVNLGILAAKGSLFVTRPTLATHIVPRARLEASAEELFDMMTSGKVKVDIEQRYALADAAKAHSDLAARKTVGSTVILPQA